MASDAATTGKKTSVSTSGSISPFVASVTILFILLIVICTTTADKDLSFPPVTSRDGATERNSMESTTRRHGNHNSKTTNNAIQIPPTGRRTGPNRVHRSSPPSTWSERVFNASAHEVPSGPNPISNRGTPFSKMIKMGHPKHWAR